PLRRAEPGGVARRLAHVGVAGNRPEAPGGVPRQRRLRAQAVEERVEVAGVGARLEQGIGQRLMGPGHRRRSTRSVRARARHADAGTHRSCRPLGWNGWWSSAATAWPGTWTTR